MAEHEQSTGSAFYGGGNQMSDDPGNIINEYLTLVREKLPEVIADDVITELESYMLETARDQGKDGQITVESAKKVVAQFGAADEYRFSMLPETIPEEDIPIEIKQDQGEKEQKKVEPAEDPPKVPGVDPTTSYQTFFIKSLILTIVWASLVSIIPMMFIPSWVLGIQLMFIIIPIAIVTVILLVQTYYLKGEKTILWKRSYPEWSIVQTLVTLPENAIPEAGTNLNRLDIIASAIGLLIFAPTTLVWSHPISTLTAIPAVFLLGARIKLIVRKLDEDKEPLEKAKQEFVVNLSLLIILESSIYWFFNMYQQWNPFLFFIGPSILIYILLFGPVLLFQLVVGTQNLWWKTEEQFATVEIVAREESVPTEEKDSPKQDLKIGVVSKGFRMFFGISGRLLLFLSVPLLVRFLTAPNIGDIYGDPIPGFTLIAIFLAVILVIGYCIGRKLMTKFLGSSTFIGTRTRLEAIIDFGISCYLLGSIIAFTASLHSIGILQYLTLSASDIFAESYNLGSVVVGIEFTAIIFAITGLPVRIIGNILEFCSERKYIAAMRIQDSSMILFATLALFCTSYYIKYIVTGNSHLINFFFLMYLLIAVYLAYQMVASGMKIEEICEQKEKAISEKSQKVQSMSNNTTMAN